MTPTGVRETCDQCGRERDTADLIPMKVVTPEPAWRWLCVDRAGCERRARVLVAERPRRWRR